MEAELLTVEYRRQLARDFVVVGVIAAIKSTHVSVISLDRLLALIRVVERGRAVGNDLQKESDTVTKILTGHMTYFA